MTKPRVVFDCMLYVQAVLQPQPVRATIRMVERGEIELYTSFSIRDEVLEVIRRPHLRKKFPSNSYVSAEELVESIFRKGVSMEPPRTDFRLVRDLKDQPYIDLAAAVRPSYLVTWNDRHLTYLMRQDTPEGKEFCTEFPDVTIVNPPEFVRQIRALIE